MTFDTCLIADNNNSNLTNILENRDSNPIKKKPPLIDDFLHLSGSYKNYFIEILGDKLIVQDRTSFPYKVYEHTGLKSGSVKFFGFDDLSRVSINDKTPYHAPDIIDLPNHNPIRIPASSLLSNDKDFHGSPLSIFDVTNPKGGEVKLLQNGKVIFTPDPNYEGIRSFEYHIKNELGFKNITPIKVYLREPHHPNDPEYFDQWYLREMNVEPVWKDYSGKGVNVAVLDEGFIPQNPDVSVNNNVYEVDYDGSPLGQHGLMVASVIGAQNNNAIGMTGIAFGANITSAQIPLGGGKGDSTNNLEIFSKYDVINNSWGYSLNGRCAATMRYQLTKDSTAVSSEELNDIAETEYAAIHGRDGKGSIIVYAGGNTLHSDSNYVLPRINPYNIIVGGFSKPHEQLTSFEKEVSHFASTSAQTLVAAPSTHFMTAENVDLKVIDNKIESIPSNVKVAGTSFSSPAVSATVALMLEANPNLGWRDVQDILAYAALPKSQNGKFDSNEYSVSGAKNSNGGGLLYNKEFGFGVADTFGAVRLAEVWDSQNTFQNYLNLHSAPKQYARLMKNGYFTETFRQAKEIEIEYIKVHIKADFYGSSFVFNDVSVKVTSPSNTTYSIFEDGGYNPAVGRTCINFGDSVDWEFGLQHARGDKGHGTWKVSIDSLSSDGSGKIVPSEIGIDFYGKPSEHFSHEMIYTSFFHHLNKDNRKTIKYSDDNLDTINTVAIQTSVKIDLSGATHSKIDGKTVRFEFGHKIKNIKAGDGDDELHGDDRDNIIMPGRGDDDIRTGDGSDIIWYPSLKWSNLGHDIIHDFDIKKDKLKIGGVTFDDLKVMMSSFEEIDLTISSAMAVYNASNVEDHCQKRHTYIGNDDWSITLLNVPSDELNESHFV